MKVRNSRGNFENAVEVLMPEGVADVVDGGVTTEKLGDDVKETINSISATANAAKSLLETDISASSFFIPNETAPDSRSSLGIDEKYVCANHVFKEIYIPEKLEGHTVTFSFYTNKLSGQGTRFGFAVDNNFSSYVWYPQYADNIVPTGVIRVYNATYGELYLVIDQAAMLYPEAQTVFKLQCNDRIYDKTYSPTIAKYLDNINPERIPDNSITIEKTNFIYEDYSKTPNILDPNKGVVGAYYAGNTTKTTMSFTPTINQYTTNYVAYDLEI